MDIRVKDIIKDNSIWLPSQDYDEKKKLSILMPTFGRWKDDFLKRAVTSYIEQTFKDTELIIIDDANTDGTSEQIDEFMRQDKRISCIRHKQNMQFHFSELLMTLKLSSMILQIPFRVLKT